QDIVGSAVLPFRGRLTGAVSAAGRLTLAYRGKSVSNLKAGRYTVAVDDRSSTIGFLLQKQKHAPFSVTGGMFLAKRSPAVNLTGGGWLVMRSAGKPTSAIVVTEAGPLGGAAAARAGPGARVGRGHAAAAEDDRDLLPVREDDPARVSGAAAPVDVDAQLPAGAGAIAADAGSVEADAPFVEELPERLCPPPLALHLHD